MDSENLKNKIAIIGMAGRFPGANSVDELWNNICNGQESVHFFTDDELRNENVPEALIQNPNYVKASPLLKDIDLFDAKFFNFSPAEAQALDPQQRIFLEEAWHALEDAGYSSEQARQNNVIGVYAGSGDLMTNYILQYIEAHPEIRGKSGSFQHLANDKDYLATRVSYKLNLKGPSLSIQTACSTSLVAIHLACESLRQGHCAIALAGGINIRVPQVGYLHEKGHIFSFDGHCRAFDANANGVLFGSGVGIVVLKPLQKAIIDQDQIHAVITATAINNDGGDKLSYTAASLAGQLACINKTLDLAQISAEEIGFVEAHGTGTAMGDPIEVKALSTAFSKTTTEKQFCALGSIKSNIGHLDAASGVTGLIKAALSIRNGIIPGLINFEKPNPKLKLNQSPFYINNTAIPWPATFKTRYAAVNNLGIGGTNAFAILEQAPQMEYKKVPLYPFNRHRYWLDAKKTTPAFSGKETQHPLLISQVALSNADQVFNGIVNINEEIYLKDHVLLQQMLFPGAAFVECVLFVANTLLGANQFEVNELVIERPLSLSIKNPVQIQLIAKKENAGYTLSIASAPNNQSWVKHLSAKIKAITPYQMVFQSLAQLEKKCPLEIEVSSFYLQLAAMGFCYGPLFQSMTRLKTGDNCAWVELTTMNTTPGYICSPALLDGAFQAILFFANSEAHLPFQIECIHYQQSTSIAKYAYIELTDKKPQQLTADIILLDEKGSIIIILKGCIARYTNNEQFKNLLAANDLNTSELKDNLLQLLAQTQPQNRELVLKAKLERIIRNILGVANEIPIFDTQGFFGMGLDSLMAVELKNRMQTALGDAVTLPATWTFEHSNINACVDDLKSRLKKDYFPDYRAQKSEGNLQTQIDLLLSEYDK